MKYLCLAYGDEKDWKALSKEQQDALLAQDEVIRRRGALMAAVETKVTTVRAWDGTPTRADGGYAHSAAPLAGFSVIEATDIDEVIRLVAGTPCARAKGAIEIRPILAINDKDGAMETEARQPEGSHLAEASLKVHGDSLDHTK